jgi:hypothetical protein
VITYSNYTFLNLYQKKKLAYLKHVPKTNNYPPHSNYQIYYSQKKTKLEIWWWTNNMINPSFKKNLNLYVSCNAFYHFDNKLSNNYLDLKS